MAERLKFTYSNVRDSQSKRLREYPDKIGGYHGCSLWRRSSSLKLQGKCKNMPVFTTNIEQAIAEKRPHPKAIREAGDG